MVRVVDVGPHKSIVKEIICRRCGATLEYAPVDVKNSFSTDYTGGRDYYNYVTCPKCNTEVTVK